MADAWLFHSSKFTKNKGSSLQKSLFIFLYRKLLTNNEKGCRVEETNLNSYKMKKLCILLCLSLSLGYVDAQDLSEFCLDDALTLHVVNTEKTSTDFFESDTNVVAMITGQQFSAPFGAESYWNYAFAAGTENCFTIFQMGKDVVTSGDEKSPPISLRHLFRMDYWLISDGAIDRQAKEAKGSVAFRTALGTKNGKHFCFASSQIEVTLEEWATLLLASGFRQAIDLSGGVTGNLTSKKLILYAKSKSSIPGERTARAN